MNNIENNREVTERLRRIETRLASFMDQMGLNVVSKTPTFSDTTPIHGGVEFKTESINVTLKQLIDHLVTNKTDYGRVKVKGTRVTILIEDLH